MAIVMNQASVGTAATFVGYIPPAGYMAALGTSPVYLGTGSAVTVSTGFQVPTSAPLVWQNSLGGPAVPVYAVAGANSQNLSFGFGNGPAGQVIAGGTAALQLDQNAADIQPVGLTASAGNSGLATDAKHVHKVPLTTPGDLLTVSAGTALARLAVGAANTVLGSNGTAPSWGPGLVQQAVTAGTGYTLVNGTGSIISWTAPNDGSLHRVQVFASMFVSSTETGGLIQVNWTGPGAGAAQNSQLFAAALASSTSAYAPTAVPGLVVAPNATVSVRQNSALTGGTATLYAEIWGS